MSRLVRAARLIADLVRVVPVSLQYGHVEHVDRLNAVNVEARLNALRDDIRSAPIPPHFDQLITDRLAAESHLRRKSA